jgi:hypothetical protein
MPRLALLVLLLAACGHHASSTQVPPPPRAIDAGAAAPDAATIAGEGCNADEQHCCEPDGTLVVPGGCQPHYQEGVQPNTDRNDDGTCKEIPCYLKCLPATALIATPDGDRPIDELAAGDTVWSQDANGARVAAHVLIVRPVPVPRDYQLVEITLADGRAVRASAEHPLAGNARGVGDLQVGDALDGSTVARVATVPYDGGQTWDLLPDAAGGTYWADGVLLGSTIAR